MFNLIIQKKLYKISLLKSEFTLYRIRTTISMMFCPNPYKRPSIESGAENRGSIESKNQLQKARKWSYPKYLFILELKILVTKQTWFACVPPVYMIYNQHNTAYHQQHIRNNIGQHSTNNTLCKRSQPWIDNMLQFIWYTFWGVGLSFMVCLFGFLVMVLFGIYGIPLWACSFGSFVFFAGSGLGESAPPGDLLDKQVLIL